MYHYMITIQYDGSAHHGWQRLSAQPDTIQGILENALSDAMHEPVKITGSGRTDAGVHALRQCADFFCTTPISKNNQQEWIKQINTTLPADIRITGISTVSKAFHSRKSCMQKTYAYCISLSGKPDVFVRKYVYCPADTPLQIPDKTALTLDLAAMDTAAQLLCGTHDFSSFTSDKTPGKSHVRSIDSISFSEKILSSQQKILIIKFTGNGFLYNMVRILAGTLLEVGLGRLSAADIPNILQQQKRSLAGSTLPPNGLFLINVNIRIFDTNAASNILFCYHSVNERTFRNWLLCIRKGSQKPFFRRCQTIPVIGIQQCKRLACRGKIAYFLF